MKTPQLVALALSAALFLLASRAHAQVPPPNAGNVTYAVVGGRELKLDLYIPTAGQAPRPLVVWIHGGGWQSGDRTPLPTWFVRMMNKGAAVASVSYRLTSERGDWGNEPVTFPAQIHDIKGAVRFLRAHASEYDLDPSRFAVWGASAGGQLAALLATSAGVAELEGDVGGNLDRSSAVMACVDYFAPNDFFTMSADVTYPPGTAVNFDAPSSTGSHYVGWDRSGQGIGDIRLHLDDPAPPYPDLVGLVRAANPITHVDPADPPMMIVHGTMDNVVPFNQSARLRDALLAAGVSTEFVVVQGGAHGNFPDAIDTRADDYLLALFGLIPPPPPPPPPPDPALCPWDLTGDGQVASSDLAVLLGAWGASGQADFNGDGSVNSADLSALLGAWGRCPSETP